MLVEDRVIVELEAVEQITPAHEAQVLSHLGLSGWRLALLLNLNVQLLQQGMRRFVR